MNEFDKKKHDERFFYFKKELIRNGAYFDFVDELLKNIQNEIIYKKIYAFLSSFIKHDGKNEHNEAIKNRALESMNKIFQNTKLDFELKINDKVDIK